MAGLDIAVRLSVSDGQRRFDLDAAFRTDADVVALHGPSGAGKSLTLRAMAGLLRPDAGHVRVGGVTLFDAAAAVDVPARARCLGLVFQDYALFPHLSVRDNVAFGLTTWRRGLDRDGADRVDDLLARFGLQAMARSRPHTLSGGQQQRVALARALACEPAALLLDEPFAALNRALRDQLRDDLAGVRERWRIPLVLVSHDADDVAALAEVAFLFEDGRVVREVQVGTEPLADASERVPPAAH